MSKKVIYCYYTSRYIVITIRCRFNFSWKTKMHILKISIVIWCKLNIKFDYLFCFCKTHEHIFFLFLSNAIAPDNLTLPNLVYILTCYRKFFQFEKIDQNHPFWKVIEVSRVIDFIDSSRILYRIQSKRLRRNRHLMLHFFTNFLQ